MSHENHPILAIKCLCNNYYYETISYSINIYKEIIQYQSITSNNGGANYITTTSFACPHEGKPESTHVTPVLVEQARHTLAQMHLLSPRSCMVCTVAGVKIPSNVSRVEGVCRCFAWLTLNIIQPFWTILSLNICKFYVFILNYSVFLVPL